MSSGQYPAHGPPPASSSSPAGQPGGPGVRRVPPQPLPPPRSPQPALPHPAHAPLVHGGPPTPWGLPPASAAPGHTAPPAHAPAPAHAAHSQALGLRGSLSGQGPGYYPAPLTSMVGSARGPQGPPQQAHMSSSGVTDRHSPLHLGVPGGWNSLGLSVGKGAALHDGRSPQPSAHPQTSAHPQPSTHSQPSMHSQPSTNATVGGGSEGPLFNLQMLVNQEMSRSAAAAASTATAVSSASMPAPSSSLSAQNLLSGAPQHESVDLSAGGDAAFARGKRGVSPISLTRAEKLQEHSVRSGKASASSAAVSSTNISSASGPLNGEVSSNSGGSEAAEVIITSKERSNMQKIPTVEGKSLNLKEPVSVIAQTPPRERQRPCPATVATVDSSSSPKLTQHGVDEKNTRQSLVYDNHVDSCKPSSVTVHTRVSSADSFERTNPIIHSSVQESSPVESTSNVSASTGCTSTVKHSEDSSSIPSPPSSMKDSSLLVTSQKNLNIKRNKKVDSILENLVEHGNKKIVPNVNTISDSHTPEQPPQAPVSTVVVAPASVIVSPPSTNEDSNGCNQEINLHSPETPQLKLNPSDKTFIDREDNVSPTFSGSDDLENGKPRRKRKLDKPVRMSKTGSDNDLSKSGSSENSDKSDKRNTEETGKTAPQSLSEQVLVEESEESIEAIAKDLHSEIILKSELVPNDMAIDPNTSEVGNKLTNDDDDATDNLLSVLVSENDRTQDLKPDTKNTFIEVESELEKMFAGIVESEESTQPLKGFSSSESAPMEAIEPIESMETEPMETVEPTENMETMEPMEESPTATSLENLNSLSSTSEVKRVMKRGRPKGSRNSGRRSSDSIFGADSSPKKKKKQPKRYFEDSPCSSQSKKLKKQKLLHSNNRDSPMLKRRSDFLPSNSVQSTAFYDSGSNTSSSRFRGPVVHIEGPRDSPYSVTIINAPSREDEDGNDKNSNKKQVTTNSRRKSTVYHNDLEFRGKVSRAGGSGAGLFSSTLSARYDSVTNDPTWICVFCKRGPHTKTGQGTIGNGDLFGPYLVGKEKSEEALSNNPFTAMEPPADEKDIVEAQKKGHKNKKSLREAEMVEQFQQKMSKKAKRSLSQDVPMRGMTPIASGGPGGGEKEEGCFEVWVHEACAVWAAGVYLVGSHIVGLQEAVWSSVRTTCNKCGEGGANVGCVLRACDWHVHYGCALDQGWDLNEESYIARCHKHKNGSYTPKSILPT